MNLSEEAESLLEFLKWISSKNLDGGAVVGKPALLKHFKNKGYNITEPDELDGILIEIERNGMVLTENRYSETCYKYWLSDRSVGVLINKICKKISKIDFGSLGQGKQLGSCFLDITTRIDYHDYVTISYKMHMMHNEYAMPIAWVTDHLSNSQLLADSKYFEEDYIFHTVNRLIENMCSFFKKLHLEIVGSDFIPALDNVDDIKKIKHNESIKKKSKKAIKT